MFEIRRAVLEDAPGISKVCTDGYRKTYPELLAVSQIEGVIQEFYNEERIRKEILEIGRGWNGWFVAIDAGQVVGAGGGGFTGEQTSELFVLYLDPDRKREGIGSKLLAAITKDQFARGAKEQWVSVVKGNRMGIPFYEAAGFDFQEERSSYGALKEDGLLSLRYKRKLR